MSNSKIQTTFDIPFTQVHNKVIDAVGFPKPIDKLVYISLMRFAFQKGHAFPSIKRLAKMNSSSENTIRTSIKRLEELGLVTKAERKEGKQQFSNMYYLHDLPDEMVEDEEKETPLQKLKGRGSKVEGEPLQKLRGTPSKVEDEEKDFNNKTMNNKNKNNNQSIQDEIQNSDLPMFIQKPLMMNKDRLIDDSINIQDIKDLYKTYEEQIEAVEFGSILQNVLESTKGKIKSIKKLMIKSIMNHIKGNRESQQEVHTGEVLPEWFKKQKEEERKRKKESSYQTDYSQYDFTKMGNTDWLKGIK